MLERNRTMWYSGVKKEERPPMSNETTTRDPFGGFYLKLVEAQHEYEQEQHIDPASMTEEERQNKIKEILDFLHKSRKKAKEDDSAPVEPIVPEESTEAAGTEAEQPTKRYMTDLIGDDYKNWHGIVVFDAGTNSGKTYFILKVLLPWAHEQHKRILFLCNRDALRNQIESDVCRLGCVERSNWVYKDDLGAEVLETDSQNKYEHTIYVETYQGLETFLQNAPDAAKTYLRSFDYIVSDEYHYMVTDASFNDHVDASYEAIKELWTTKTCIFMSATARPFFDYWELRKMIPEGQHYRLPMDYRFVSSVKFFYRDDDELDIIRRVQPGEKILVFVNTIAKLRKLRDTLKAEGIEDVACLCSKYRQEAEEFDKLDDVLKGNVLQHQVTLTTTTLYNGVDMKDRALKYVVSELWNPLVNAQILGRKRPLDEGDTCAVYLLHYPKERLEGEVKKIQKYQLEPVEAYKEWFDDKKAWKAYLHQPETLEILKKSHTVVLDPREGEYCWRKRANLQARVERVFLLQMLEQGYQTELLKKIDESLLAKVERLEPPLLEYLDAHLNEERYYQDWQKIFFELGHIYNKADGHAEKSLPSYTRARKWLLSHGYDLQKKRVTSGELRNKNVWWVTK